MQDYTTDQIGEIKVRPINKRTKELYSLLVVQPRSNDQVTVLEPCSWQTGRTRVIEMVARGVDPFDIRFCVRSPGQTDTSGLPLRPVNEALWWTDRDERAVENANQK